VSSLGSQKNMDTRRFTPKNFFSITIKNSLTLAQIKPNAREGL
jgi:hypothetical protein